MQCRDVEVLDSSYIDGELDDARASAFRGHLRICAPCRQRVEDLAALVDAAARLSPIDPPASLWSAIERGLAEAEIADAQRSWLWLRWQAIRPRLLPGAVAVAAAAVLVLWFVRHNQAPRQARLDDSSAAAEETASRQPEPSPRPSEAPGDERSPENRRSFMRAQEDSVLEADRRYLSAIAELRQIVDDERETWPDATRDAYESRVADFERAARRKRQALAVNEVQEPRSRDELYAVYRAKIAFLQEAAVAGAEGIGAAGAATHGGEL